MIKHIQDWINILKNTIQIDIFELYKSIKFNGLVIFISVLVSVTIGLIIYASLPKYYVAKATINSNVYFISELETLRHLLVTDTISKIRSENLFYGQQDLQFEPKTNILQLKSPDKNNIEKNLIKITERVRDEYLEAIKFKIKINTDVSTKFKHSKLFKKLAFENHQIEFLRINYSKVEEVQNSLLKFIIGFFLFGLMIGLLFCVWKDMDKVFIYNEE